MIRNEIKFIKERAALMKKCPICQSVLMPSSMESHARYHKQLQREESVMNTSHELDSNEKRPRTAAQE